MEPKLTGAVGANVVLMGNAAKDLVAGTCINAGGKIKSKGFYAQLEGGLGSLKYVKTELGKDFNFKESGFGLNTSIVGQYTVGHKEKNYYLGTSSEGIKSPTWKANDTRGYAQVALTYNNPTIEVGLGVRGGVKTSTQPSLDGVTLADIGETRGTEYAGRTTKSFVEPTGNVKVNLGNGWKIALQAAPSQGSLGLSLNF